MKNRRKYAVMVLVAGLAVAGVHTADMLLWTDPVTGFATAGTSWIRYLPWLVVLLLPYRAGRRVAAQPVELADTCPPLGVCMILTAVLLALSCLLTIPTAQYVIAYPEQFVTYPVWAAWADVFTPVLCGMWLLIYGVRAFLGYGIHRKGLGRALPALVVPLFYLWRLVWRFQIVPASIERLPCTLRIVSAVAALLFAAALLKIFLTPGLPCGQTIYAAGAGAFLLCTCLELPQTLFEAWNGMLTTADFVTGLAYGAFGLCGLVCAWAACGADTD